MRWRPKSAMARSTEIDALSALVTSVCTKMPEWPLSSRHRGRFGRFSLVFGDHDAETLRSEQLDAGEHRNAGARHP